MLKSIPFTYLLKHIPTKKYYYGVRFKKNCHPNDLWTKYFTSSKKVKGLIKRYGKKSFIFEIRKTFKTQREAIKWENKVLKRMKVIYRKDFLNFGLNTYSTKTKAKVINHCTICFNRKKNFIHFITPTPEMLDHLFETGYKQTMKYFK